MKPAQSALIAIIAYACLTAVAWLQPLSAVGAVATNGPRAGLVLENGEFTTELNGLKLWYKVAGTGPVCLMPTPAWGPSSDVYFRTLKPLEKLFTVVYLDSRGTGRSQRAKSPTDYTWEHLVADLDALRAHLKQPKVWLMGHSEGGTQILQYACRYPQRVSGLIILDGVAAHGADDQADAMSRAALRKDQPWYPGAVAALRTPPKTEQHFVELMGKALPLFWSEPDKIDKFKDDFAATTFSVEASNGQNESRGGPFDLRAQLKKVTAPALIVVGADDFICPLVAAREMHLSLQNSKLLVIEKCGHFSWMEQADEFNAQVPRFLEALGVQP